MHQHDLAWLKLVIAHAFFYGALLRTNSPYTLLLSVVAVVVGQAMGVWLWRRRHARSQRERQSARPPGCWNNPVLASVEGTQRRRCLLGAHRVRGNRTQRRLPQRRTLPAAGRLMASGPCPAPNRAVTTGRAGRSAAGDHRGDQTSRHPATADLVGHVAAAWAAGGRMTDVPWPPVRQHPRSWEELEAGLAVDHCCQWFPNGTGDWTPA
jgi:hypothetical protein